MSIQSEIARIEGAKADLKTYMESKGLEVSSEDKLDDYPEILDELEFYKSIDETHCILYRSNNIKETVGYIYNGEVEIS